MKISTLLKKLKFDWVNPEITDSLFPDTGDTGAVELFHFDDFITTQEAIERMKQKGYRQAKAHELLAWAKDSWKGEDVVALGQIVQAVGGVDCVLSVWRDGAGRKLSLFYVGYGWYRGCRFAGVRESDTKTVGTSETLNLESLDIRLKEEREKIKKDLLEIADQGEYEELRREVIRYFESLEEDNKRI